MIKIIEGNILDATEDIIAHQVNCRGKMGAGLAKQIKDKFPQVYREYRRKCQEVRGKPDVLLGSCQLIYVSNQGKIIANLFGQLNYGRNEVQTDYHALIFALHKLSEYAKQHSYSVALPHGIGCGLAGGNWDLVYELIDTVFRSYNVVLYKLK